jgi:Tol biopolymer transport system component
MGLLLLLSLGGIALAAGSGAALHQGTLSFYLEDAARPGLYLLDIRTGTRHRLSDQVTGAGGFAWSPDGTRLVIPAAPLVEVRQFSDEDFVTTVIAPGQLRLLSAQGRSLGSLATAAAFARNPRWSPDGRWIGFEADTESGMLDLFVLPAAGGALHNLTDTPDALEEYLTWSPDSRRIAYQAIDFRGFRMDATRFVYLVNADGTQRRRVLDNAFFPAWSPDGGRLLYFHWGEARELFLTDLAGPPVQLDDALYSAPAWSPDGARVAYVRQTGGRAGIRILGADGRVQQDVPPLFASATPPLWSPDGRWLAFGALSREGYGLYVVATDSGVLRPVLRGPGMLFPVWQPAP